MSLLDNVFVMDCEGDGLVPTKIHVLSCTQDGKTIFSTTDYDKMRSFLLGQKYIVVHNGIRWDAPNLERLLGITIPGKIIDSLALSWYLYPQDEDTGKRKVRHGLEEWGEIFGVPKPPISDWNNLSVEEYTHRCEEDVKINFRLWQHQLNKLKIIYDKNESKIIEFIDYLYMKMTCARLQEESGWVLDQKRCTDGLMNLLKEQEDKITILKGVMPKVKVFKKKTPPKRMYSKNGSLTKIGQSWTELLESLNLKPDTDEVEVFDSYEEPNPNSPDQVKDWLFSLGWKPETFKEVKDKDGKNKRQVPQVNKEKQKRENDNDILCNSVVKLFEKEPLLVHLQGLGIIKHRIGILSGFLRDVDASGKLRARIAGLTNTLRFKHAEIVNLPKVGLPWADDLRASLSSGPDEELLGADMSGLEDRLKQHFIYPFDPDYVREMNREDYDPHLSLALLAKKITKNQMDDYISGKDKSIKPIRDIYKNGNYACQYNAYPPRLAITCGISLKEAKEVFDVYWKKNWAIKEAVKPLKVKELSTGEMWQLNPVNGFWYSLRTKNDQFSTLVQGTASYVFDKWVEYVISKRRQLTAQFHDEIVLTVKKGFREQADKLLNDSIKWLNDLVKLNRELAIGIQYGERYSEIH